MKEVSLRLSEKFFLELQILNEIPNQGIYGNEIVPFFSSSFTPLINLKFLYPGFFAFIFYFLANFK